MTAAVQPVPLRADPSATQRAAMASLTRAVLATGLATFDRANGDHAKRAWPDDNLVSRMDRVTLAHASTPISPAS